MHTLLRARQIVSAFRRVYPYERLLRDPLFAFGKILRGTLFDRRQASEASAIVPRGLLYMSKAAGGPGGKGETMLVPLYQARQWTYSRFAPTVPGGRTTLVAYADGPPVGGSATLGPCGGRRRTPRTTSHTPRPTVILRLEGYRVQNSFAMC